jgi:hypothetical protein
MKTVPATSTASATGTYYAWPAPAALYAAPPAALPTASYSAEQENIMASNPSVVVSSTSALSFPKFAWQQEKIYQISSLGSANNQLCKRYYVFTGTELQNGNTKIDKEKEYKLLIPVHYVTMKQNLQACYSAQDVCRFKVQREVPVVQREGTTTLVICFPNGAKAECEFPHTLKNFLKAVTSTMAILLRQVSVNLFDQEYKRITVGRSTSLFPSFSYEKPEFQKIELRTRPHKLGFEGTPVRPVHAQKRLTEIKNLMELVCPSWAKLLGIKQTTTSTQHQANIKDPYFGLSQQLRHRILNLATIIEEQVYEVASTVQNLLHSLPHHAAAIKMANLFLGESRWQEYSGLRNYPDIMYQVMVGQGVLGLVSTGNSLKVVTNSKHLVPGTGPQAPATTARPSQHLVAGFLAPASKPSSQLVSVIKISNQTNSGPLLSALLQQEDQSPSVSQQTTNTMQRISIPPQKSAAPSKPGPPNRTVLNNKGLLCPFQPLTCSGTDEPYRDVTSLLRHLNQAHFAVNLESLLSNEQRACAGLIGQVAGSDVTASTTCPVQPCGFIAPSRAELIWHYSRCSAITAILLNQTAKHLPRYAALARQPALRPVKVQPDPVNCAQCSVCKVTVQAQNLQCHQALVHYRYVLRAESFLVSTPALLGRDALVSCRCGGGTVRQRETR